jgi:hypothetical protein
MISFDGETWSDYLDSGSGQWTSTCWSPELGIFASVAFSGGDVMNSLYVKRFVY